MNYIKLPGFFVIALTAVLLLTNSGSAQAPDAARPNASPTPLIATDEDVIRIKTNLVQVDVVAVDDKGHQVKGLTAADFKIIDKGREQVPELVSYVSLDREPGNNVSLSGHPSADQLGRVFVFVVSNPVIQYGFSSPGSGGGAPRTGTFTNAPNVRRAADSTRSLLSWFIDTQMTNADLAAIASTEVDLGVLSSFTNDRVVLGAAMKRVRAASREAGVNVTVVGPEISMQSLANFNLRVMETLENVIQQVEPLPGRKVVTLFSGGLLYNANLPYYQIINERLERLIKRANNSRISIYTLHTRDLSQFSRSFGNDGLIHLSKETGGRAIYNVNDLRVEFDKVIEENRGYYLLAYNPGADFQQRPASLEVRVNRSGVKVLSRSEALVPKAIAARDQLAQNPFASPLSSNDIGLNLSSSLSPTNAREVLTSCRVDLSQVTVRPRPDGRQTLSLGLSIRVAGPDGRDFKRADRDLSFDLSLAELETAKRDGVVSIFSFDGDKPGFYRISVAVRDNYSGRAGNSRIFFEAPGPPRSTKTTNE